VTVDRVRGCAPGDLHFDAMPHTCCDFPGVDSTVPKPGKDLSPESKVPTMWRPVPCEGVLAVVTSGPGRHAVAECPDAL